MDESSTPIHAFTADELGAALVAWLRSQTSGPLLVSLEETADGAWVAQALPEVDPLVVARVRRTLAQHADVLRRLT